jgi:hypothetical protein
MRRCGAACSPFAVERRSIATQPFREGLQRYPTPREVEPIPLSRSQATIVRVLWEREGVLISGPPLIRMAGLELGRPIDASPGKKYPEANRAYRTIVFFRPEGTVPASL